MSSEISDLSDESLYCDRCQSDAESPPGNLERVDQGCDDSGRYEIFECQVCGSRGSVEVRDATGRTARFGCVVTARMLDLRQADAAAAIRGGDW